LFDDFHAAKLYTIQYLVGIQIIPTSTRSVSLGRLSLSPHFPALLRSVRLKEMSSGESRNDQDKIIILTPNSSVMSTRVELLRRGHTSTAAKGFSWLADYLPETGSKSGP
jgi:hypothetical protein